MNLSETSSGRQDTVDPLELGERVIAILQHGQRLATYKLATLRALIDYCLSHVPAETDAELDVPIDALADGVMRLYWQQVLPFEQHAHRLYQSPLDASKRLTILTEVELLRAAVGGDKGARITFASAQCLAPEQYKKARDSVATTLRKYPLRLLQQMPTGGGQVTTVPILYDAAWMDGSAKDIKAHGRHIRLFPGVASALARLSGLLIPTINVLWVEKVHDLNPAVSENLPDFATYLFGRDRAALQRVRKQMVHHFSEICFYCGLRPATVVDHVLPWSRTHLDSLCNLVQACAKCNGDKTDVLPAPKHVQAALGRSSVAIDEIALELNWPAEFDRVRAIARGLYKVTPAQTPIWSAYKELELFDPLDWPQLLL